MSLTVCPSCGDDCLMSDIIDVGVCPDCAAEFDDDDEYLYDYYDGQPDEAQEWHDFDPDC